MGTQWLDGEQDRVLERTLRHDRQFGFTAAVTICLAIEALAVLFAIVILRVAS